MEPDCENVKIDKIQDKMNPKYQ